MFVVVGARDFSPEITVLPIGTSVSELTLYAVTGKSRAPTEFPHKFRFIGSF